MPSRTRSRHRGRHPRALAVAAIACSSRARSSLRSQAARYRRRRTVTSSSRRAARSSSAAARAAPRSRRVPELGCQAQAAPHAPEVTSTQRSLARRRTSSPPSPSCAQDSRSSAAIDCCAPLRLSPPADRVARSRRGRDRLQRLTRASLRGVAAPTIRRAAVVRAVGTSGRGLHRSLRRLTRASLRAAPRAAVVRAVGTRGGEGCDCPYRRGGRAVALLPRPIAQDAIAPDETSTRRCRPARTLIDVDRAHAGSAARE